MKIRIASDLHLEFEQAAHSPDCGRLATSLANQLQADLGPEDLLILAGDTHRKSNGVTWAKRHFPQLEVLMIGGNHEFYGAKFPRQTVKNQARTEGTRIRYLENQVLEKDGYHFFGATLWTDFAAYGDSAIAMVAALEHMNDYECIRYKQGKKFPEIRPEQLLGAHYVTRRSIIEFLESRDPSKCVIVTHHAPSPRSLDASYGANNPLNAAYASDLEGIIGRFQPRLWVHGHTHTSRRYQLGDTEVICNPRGYVKTPNPEFDPKLTVQL